MKKKWSVIALSISLMLIVNACGHTGTEKLHTSTIALTTVEITTEETPESTEQTENFAFEVLYSINERSSVKEEDRSVLITNRAEFVESVFLSQQLSEKYTESWFETHALICLEAGGNSCDRAALNRIEIDEGMMTIYIDIIHSSEEGFYEKLGKDYEIQDPGTDNCNLAVGSTVIILEIDKDDEALVKSLKTVMRKVRYWPSFEWRALIVDL